MKYHWIKKYKALVVALFVFVCIGICFNIIYIIAIFSQQLIAKSEIFIELLFSGIYFGVFTGCFILYYQYFKKNKKWFTVKSALIVGFIVFTFFAFYCNAIYIVIPYSAGMQIQLETISIYLILGIFFGISSIFLVKFGSWFKPKNYDPETYKIPFKGAVLLFLFVFSFFAICFNIISIIVSQKIQIEYILFICFLGLFAGILAPLIFLVDPDDLPIFDLFD
ncbi:MAG: hypothetical protein ACFFBP_19880 [Promethearchaeota archaeon]